MENRNRVCQNHGIHEKSKRKCDGSELREHQFQAEQNRQDQNANLDQPRQSGPFVENGLQFGHGDVVQQNQERERSRPMNA